MSNTAGKHVVPKGEGHVNCYYDVIYGPNRFVVVASYAVIFIYSSSDVVLCSSCNIISDSCSGL